MIKTIALLCCVGALMGCETKVQPKLAAPVASSTTGGDGATWVGGWIQVDDAHVNPPAKKRHPVLKDHFWWSGTLVYQCSKLEYDQKGGVRWGETIAPVNDGSFTNAPAWNPGLSIEFPTQASDQIAILQINDQDGLMVAILSDGTGKFGENYHPDDAARTFWIILSQQYPMVCAGAQRRPPTTQEDIVP